MAAYPGFVRLVRLLGREHTLAALALDNEIEPDRLMPSQRARLSALVDSAADSLATQLVDEAAANDDVSDRPAATAFVQEEIRIFGDLLSSSQAARILAHAQSLIDGWAP